MNFRFPCLLAFAVLPCLTPLASAGEKAPPRISWRKAVIDPKFRSEGVAVADVNKDGKPDILVGDYWYEAPDWKQHEIRKPGSFGDGANGYSQSFACWSDDINGDGWADLVVIGFPGQPCHWYENPQRKDGHWKQHFINKSACNETPQYLDLFGTGKRVLLMGTENTKMIWLAPGKDVTQPWDVHHISDPSKGAPGTNMFAHGLGVGDINGDGKLDVIVTEGWWEQPAKLSDTPWTFHRGDLGPGCADMYAVDVDGDGKADVISSAAHDYGMWAHLQRPGNEDPAFVLQPLFPTPNSLAKEPADHKLGKEEQAVYRAINKLRNDGRRAPFAASAGLCEIAEKVAASAKEPGSKYEGKIVATVSRKDEGDAVAIAQELLKEASKDRDVAQPGFEIGIGYHKPEKGEARYTLVIGNPGKFSLPSQTHALNYADIDGDGVKDFVTGRRWWAHGPKGDPGSGDSAFLYWFKASRDSKGMLTLTPNLIDEDSGVGTQFAIADMNGDGVPDIVISNKRGVCIIMQVRAPAIEAPAPKNKD